MSFCIWLISFSISSRSIVYQNCIPFQGRIICHCMYRPQLVYLLLSCGLANVLPGRMSQVQLKIIDVLLLLSICLVDSVGLLCCSCPLFPIYLLSSCSVIIIADLLLPWIFLHVPSYVGMVCYWEVYAYNCYIFLLYWNYYKYIMSLYLHLSLIIHFLFKVYFVLF